MCCSEAHNAFETSTDRKIEQLDLHPTVCVCGHLYLIPKKSEPHPKIQQKPSQKGSSSDLRGWENNSFPLRRSKNILRLFVSTVHLLSSINEINLKTGWLQRGSNSSFDKSILNCLEFALGCKVHLSFWTLPLCLYLINSVDGSVWPALRSCIHRSIF